MKGDTADRLYKGEWQPPEPLLLRGYKGKVPADFQWSSFPPIVCVSQRVLDILNENRFTGWSTYPVSVYGRRGEPLPGYYGFAITGWAGDWDLSQSPVMQKGPLAPGGKTWKVYKGMYFDQTAWNGSDIFRVGRRGAPGYAVVTARVRQAFERAKVTNVKFTPLSELELDTVIFKSRVRQAQDTAQVTKR